MKTDKIPLIRSLNKTSFYLMCTYIVRSKEMCHLQERPVCASELQGLGGPPAYCL